MISGNTTYQVLLIRIPSEGQLIPIYSWAYAKGEKTFLNVWGSGKSGIWKPLFLRFKDKILLYTGGKKIF